jgi:O-antigen ligase
MSLALPDTRALAPSDVHERFVRGALFLVCFLLITITVSPFTDLGSSAVLDPVGGGNSYGQIASILLTIALVAFVLVKAPRIALHAVTPVLVLLLGWILLTSALSPNSGLALRRSVLAIMTIANAVALLLLPMGREHFARLLATGCLIVLAVCYAGVLLLPQYSIHQATDIAEPVLAGAWRGAFEHKNGAGATMVLFIFLGIFAARAGSRIAGVAVVVGAGLFLPFTQSKSPMGLLLLTLLLAFAIVRTRSDLARWTLVLATVVLVNLLTVGTVMIGPVGKLLSGFMSDASFTGRDVIWRFAIDSTLARPITGHGFQAFWGTDALLFNWNINESWGMRASDAHNAYLNLAVMIGVVGLALALAWIVLQPLADLARLHRTGFDPALTTMFVQIWIFGLLLSGTESVLISAGGLLWFLMAVSIIGLRLQRIHRLKE